MTDETENIRADNARKERIAMDAVERTKWEMETRRRVEGLLTGVIEEASANGVRIEVSAGRDVRGPFVRVTAVTG